MSDSNQIYRRLVGYLTPHRRRFFMALGAMVVYGASDGAVPYLLKRILDDVFGSRDSDMLTTLVFVVVGFAIIRGVFGFLQRYLAASVGLAVVRDLRNEIVAKLLSLSPGFYNEQTTGGLISRVTNDTLLVRTALTDAAAVILRDSIRVVTLLIVAFYLDPVLALIALVGLPIGFAPVIKFGKKIRKLSRSGQDFLGELTSLLQETIVGHRVVQAFNREQYEQQRFEKENDQFTNAFQRAEKYGALSGPTNEVVASLAIACVLLYGGLSVINGVRTQGDFIAFLTAMFLLYEPVKKLSRINTLVQAGVAAAQRIFEILDVPTAIAQLEDAKVLSSEHPKIVYDSVYFNYQATPQQDASNTANNISWVLQDINLSIEPGETLALVGTSGGGKSSLVHLLPRFFDPQRGAIEIDGTDIRHLTLESLRDHISLVGQHTFLFHDSVHNNIAYGRQGATLDQIVESAKAANAHEFIEALPQKYDTILGEQGFSLSGGQRARLAIARALLRDAPILILDEATASLDSESEGLVQAAIDRLMDGRTVLVIAHRLATIRRANNIAVISNGRIVEHGSHDQLLALSGEYARLYLMQFKDDVPEMNRAVHGKS